MTITETMQEMFQDSVYITATLRDPARAEEEITRCEAYYAENPSDPDDAVPIFPGLPDRELTWEQLLAKELHDNLYKVVLAAWARTYSREQMVQLLNLLTVGEAGLTDTVIRICPGGEEEGLWSLQKAWNDNHPEEKPIIRAAPYIG